MSSLAAIRTAIKTTLNAAIADLNTYDTVPDASNLPCVVVAPVNADFDVSMGRGLDTWHIDLFVLVSDSERKLAQDQLDSFVTGAGPRSIRQAIFLERTLGLSEATGTSAHISGMTSYGAKFTMSALPHVGAKLRLTVHTKGTE